MAWRVTGTCRTVAPPQTCSPFTVADDNKATLASNVNCFLNLCQGQTVYAGTAVSSGTPFDGSLAFVG